MKYILYLLFLIPVILKGQGLPDPLTGSATNLSTISSDYGPRHIHALYGSRFHGGFDYDTDLGTPAYAIEGGAIKEFRFHKTDGYITTGNWRYVHIFVGQTNDLLWNFDEKEQVLIIREPLGPVSNQYRTVHVYAVPGTDVDDPYKDKITGQWMPVEYEVQQGDIIFRAGSYKGAGSEHLHLDRGRNSWENPFTYLARNDANAPIVNSVNFKYINNGKANDFPVFTNLAGNSILPVYGEKVIVTSDVKVFNGENYIQSPTNSEYDLDDVILLVTSLERKTQHQIFSWHYTGANHLRLTSRMGGTSDIPANNIRRVAINNIKNSIEQGIFPHGPGVHSRDVFKFHWNTREIDATSTNLFHYKYPDGQYNIDAIALDLASNQGINSCKFIIDNLRPFIQKVEIRKNNSYGDALYIGEWKKNGASLSLNQQKLGSATQKDDIWVKITPSEPMTNLTLKVLTYTNTSTNPVTGSNNKEWEFIIPRKTLKNYTNTTIPITISGIDYADHPLQVNANEIAIRKANGEWEGTINEGSDITHLFNFTPSSPKLTIKDPPINGNDLAEGFFPFTSELTNCGEGKFKGTVAMILRNSITSKEVEITRQNNIIIPGGDKFILQNLNYELTEGQYQVITRYSTNNGETWNNVTGSNNPYTIKVTKLGGVDMTSATIAGLRIDDTQNIKFLFRGNSDFSPGDPVIELDSASATLQRVFMQALIVPNYNQWISINPSPEYYSTGTGRMYPTAPEPFMNTEMAYRMLESDAYLKLFWDTTFRQQAHAYWNELVTSSRIWPSIKAKGFDNGVFCPSRACIIPGLVSANASDGDIFIDSAKLDVESSHFNCCFVNDFPLPLSKLSFNERKVLDSLLDVYSKNYTQRLQERNNSFKASLNNDKYYKGMRDIYPAIALAHWYKEQDGQDPYFQSVISSNDLTNLTDPAFTEADLNKINGNNSYYYQTHAPSGKPLRFRFSGGNTMKRAKPTIADTMSANQKNVTNEVIEKNKTLVKGDTVFFSGKTSLKVAPDLHPSITSKGTTNPVEGHPSTIKTLLTNKGNLAASNVKITYYYRHESSSNHICIGDTIIPGIDGFSSTSLKKTFILPKEGKCYLEVRTDEQNTIIEAKENNNQDIDSIMIKTNVPEVSIIYPLTGKQILQTGIKLKGSAYDNMDGNLHGTSLKWSSDKDGLLGFGGSATVDSLSTGLHVISLTATNSLGIKATSRIFMEVFEPGCPIVKIISPSGTSPLSSHIDLNFNAIANDYMEGELNNCEWYSNKQGFLGKGTSITANLIYTGEHEIIAKAHNIAGKYDSDTILVAVQDGYPQINLTKPVLLNYLQHQDIEFLATANDIQDGDISENIRWASDLIGEIGTGSSIQKNITPGTHTISASVTDKDGLTIDTTFMLNIACTPPIPVIIHPSGYTEVNEGKPFMLKGTATDLQDGVIHGEQLSWSSDKNGFLGTGDSLLVTNLTPAYHTISLKATDNDGADSITTTVIYVGKAMPVIHTMLPFNGMVSYMNKPILFDSYVFDEQDGQLDGDNLIWTSDKEGIIGKGARFYYPGLGIGKHKIKLTATDIDGNSVNKVTNVTIYVSRPPYIRLVKPTNPITIYHSSKTILEAKATDPEDGILDGNNILWFSDIDGIIGQGANLEHTFASTGKHKLTVKATDSTNISRSASTFITVKQLNPSVNITSPSTGTVFTIIDSILFTGGATDYEDGNLTGSNLIWTSDKDGFLGSGSSIKTNPLSAGNHNIKLTATDSQGGLTSKNIEIQVNSINPPTVVINTPSPNSIFKWGEEIKFIATAKDENGIILTGNNLAWYSEILGKLGNGDTLKLNNLDIGSYLIKAIATDNYGFTAVAKTQLTITNNKPVVEILNPGNNQTFTNGQIITFTGSATDTEDGILNESALVWTSDINGKIGTGTNLQVSNLNIGTHNIRLKATDSNGAISYSDITIKIVVQNPPSLSVISPVNSTKVIHGKPIILKAIAKDYLNIPLQDNNIKWESSVDGDIGMGKTLTYSDLSVGQHQITVTATDNYGKSTYSNILISITQALPTASLLFPVNNSIVADTTNIKFEGLGNDYEDGSLIGSSLVWHSDKDGEIGIGSGFSKKLTKGRHTITLTVTDSQGAKSTEQVIFYVTSYSYGVIATTPDGNPCLEYSTPGKDTVIYFSFPRNAIVSEATFDIIGKRKSLTSSKSDYVSSSLPKERIDNKIDSFTLEAINYKNSLDYDNVIFYDIQDSSFSLKANKEQLFSLDYKEQAQVIKNTKEVPETERQILISLYDSTDGANWKKKANWKTTNPVSTWYGITVENGHVTKINLYSNNLKGTIPEQLGNLVHLTELDLEFNSFVDIILPESFENLVNLKKFYINNVFYYQPHPFPNFIYKLTKLEELNLVVFGAQGSLSSEIGKLQDLKKLNFQDLWEAIPSEVFDLPALEFASFFYARVNTIPKNINNAPKLKYLNLKGGNLTSLPSLDGVIAKGMVLNIEGNKLTFEDFEPIIENVEIYDRFSPFNTVEPGKVYFTNSAWYPNSSGGYGGHIAKWGQQKVGKKSSNTVYSRTDFTFNVDVGGAYNSYQWYKDSVAIPGATSPSYTLNNIQFADAGVYHCVIKNSKVTYFNLSSNDMTLKVIPDYPTNPLMDIGNDNNTDWYYLGTYGETQTTDNFAHLFNNYINANSSNDSIIKIPVKIRFDEGYELDMCNINIQYTKTDITPPDISSVNINPIPVTKDSSFSVSAIVKDNVHVKSVKIYFDSKEYTMLAQSPGDTLYQCNIPTNEAGKLPLTIIATDNSNLQSNYTSFIPVITTGIDLSVKSTDIKFLSPEIKEGELIYVICKVWNLSDKIVEDVPVAFLVNGQVRSIQNLSHIVPLNDETSRFAWTPEISDTTITIIADYDNKFAEYDELNNSATVKVYPKDMSPPVFTGFELSPNPSVEGDQLDIWAYVKDNKGIKNVNCTWNGVETLLKYSAANDAYTEKIIAAVTGTTTATCTATDINGLSNKISNTITILPSKPDASIVQSDIQVPPGTYSQGQSIEFNLLVHNYGGTAINECNVKFLVDGNVVDDKNISIDSTSLVPFSWINKCGKHDFSFILDESNLIEESNENNNTATLPVNFCTSLPPIISDISILPNPVIEMENFSISATIDFTGQEDSVVAVFKGEKFPLLNISGNNYMVTIPSGQYGKYDVLITAYDANGMETEAYTAIEINKLEADIWQISEDVSLPTFIQEGNMVNISSIVHNTGNIDVSNVLVYLYANEKLVDSSMISIPANGEEISSFKWIPVYSDKYLEIVADPHNAYIEPNETNNVAIRLVNIEDNTPPVIRDLNVNPNPFYQNKEASVILNATDNTPLKLSTYNWKGIVDTMEFNPVLKEFEANLTSTDTGTFVLLCNVYDMSGFESQQSINVKVLPQLADLSINDFDINMDSTNVNGHDTTYIYLNVHNKGGTAVYNAEVRFLLDGEPQQSVLIDLQAYSQEQLSFAWEAICDNHNFTFIVDEKNTIPEMNEDNNEVTRSMCFCNPVPPTIITLSTEPVNVVQDSSFLLKALVTDNDSIHSVSAIHQGQSFDLLYNNSSDYYEVLLNNNNVIGNKNIIVQASNTYNLTSNDRVQYKSISILPDISIGQVSHNKTLIEANKMQSSAITINNTGGSNANDLLVHFYANNQFEDSVIINVSAQSSTDINFEWIPTMGSQPLMIFADPSNRVTESDENNNQWTGDITAYDIEPPVIIRIDANDTVFEGEQINISALVTDNDSISEVKVIYNNTPFQMIFDNLSETYKVTIPNILFNCNQFDVLATDISGLTTRQERLINVYKTLPDLEVKPSDISTLVMNNENSVRITSILHNRGCLPVTDAKVNMLLDGKIIDSTTITIDSMKSKTWEVLWSGVFGYHKITVQVDTDNNVQEINESNNVAEITFYFYDITPPDQPKPVCNISGWSNIGDFIISWDKVKDVSGIRDYQYSINNGQWISTGIDTTVNLNINSVGITQINVIAEDSAGNFSIPGETFALFDNISPESPALSETHCRRDWTMHNSPMLSWNNPGDKGSGINNYRILIDNQNIIDVANINHYHLNIYKSGEHTFRVKAIDKTGNESEWSNEVKVWIDLSCPHKTNIYSITHPDENNWYNLDSVQLNWDTPQDTSYIKGYFYLLNKDSKTVPSNSAFWYTGTSITLNSLPFMTEENIRIPEGVWYFHLVSMDAVGNMDTIGANYKINIDRSPPQTSFQIKKSNEQCPNIIQFSSKDYYSGVAKTYYRLNMGIWEEGTKLTIDKPGINIIDFYSVDQAGNVEEAKTTTYDYDGIRVEHVVKDLSCQNSKDGAILVDVSGGMPPYIYKWSNQSVSKDLENLDEGIYELIVKDQRACETKLTDTVAGYQFEIDIEKKDDIEGTCTGSAIIHVKGGKKPFKYYWKDINSYGDSLYNMLCEGQYSVVVTDANNCSISDSVFLLGNGEGCIVYPNPNDGEFWIALPGAKTEFVEIIIMDISGRLIIKDTYPYMHSRPIKMTIPNEQIGVFLLKIKLDNNKTFLKKVFVKD